MNYQKELTIVSGIARKAGDLALKFHQGDLGIECKADDTPVTLADKACEKFIVSELAREFPGDGMLGEEGTTRESANGRRWVIDPIDGTRDFIRHTRAWTVLIGLEEEGKVVVGVEYFPATGEIFSAAKGQGAWWDGRKMCVSSIARKNEAMLCCNGLSYLYRYPFAPDFVTWISQFWTVRSSGGCHDAMMVASGRAEAWIEPVAQPWDLAPLKIIAEEAGCVTFDFAGNDTIYGGNFVITAPAFADELREFVSRR